MADLKFSGFASANPLVSGDELVGLQSGVNIRAKIDQVLTYVQDGIEIAESQVTGLVTDLASKLDLAGGTMTGDLILNGDPTVNLQAATKKYVDDSSAAVTLNTAYAATTGQNFNITSNLNLLGGSLNIGTSTSDSSAIFQIESSTQGLLFPRMTSTQRDAISSPASGLEIYNTTTKTFDYYDSTSWQKLLNTENLNGSGTVTVTDNGDGSVTIFGSGGGSSPTPAFGSYAVKNNTAPRSGTTTFAAVPVSSGFTDVSDQTFTSQTMTIAGVNTVGSTYIGMATASFQVNQSCLLRSTDSAFREYYYAIAILRSGGSIETTAFQGYTNTNQTILFPAAVGLNGVVTLSPGDTVFTQIMSSLDVAVSPTFTITSEITSIAGTEIPLFQQIYNGSDSYPDSEINLGASGSIQYNYGSEISFGAGSTGIASTLGLRLLPAIGTDASLFIQTNDPTSTLAENISITKGVTALPAMTAAQGGAIGGTKPTGLGFYDTDQNTYQLWTSGSVWTSLVNSTSNQTIGGTKNFIAPFYIQDGSSNSIYSFATTNADFELPLRVALNSDVDLIFLGNTNQPLCSIFEVFSSDFGSIPFPIVSLAKRNSWPVDADSRALGAFISDTQTIDYYTGATWTSLINSTADQTIGGTKTFSSPIVGDLGGVASSANSINTLQASTNVSFYPLFVASSSNGYQSSRLGLGMTFNPFTNNLTTTTFTGNLVGNASTVTTNANLTGDVSSTGNSTLLATVNSNVGSFGSATQVANFTVNGKGLITAASNTTISGVAPGGSAGGDLSSTYPNPTVAKINGVTLGSTTATAGNLLIGSGTQWVSNAMSGNVTINSTGLTTIGAAQVTNAMLAGSIDLTSKVTGDLPFANGGFGFHTATTGDIFYASATNTPAKLADVATGSVLTSGGVGVAPAWSATPTLTSLNLPNGQALVLGATSANQLTITSSSGANNRADIALNRNDFTNGNCRFFFQTNTANQWSNGMRGGSGDYQIFDEVNAVTQLRMTQGSSTTGVSTFAGSIIINSSATALTLQNGAAINAKNTSATSEVFMYPRFGDNKTYMDIGSAGATFRQNAAGATWMSVDTSSNVTFNTGNVIINTATAGYQQKSAAVSAGTANAILVTSITLTAGSSGTINNSAITTSHIGFAVPTTRAGTATTLYQVTCSAGSFSVSGGSLDTSTVAVWFIKAL